MSDETLTEEVNEEHESMQGGELVYRASDPQPIRFEQDGDADPVLTGRMMPYGQWTEIRSRTEGHFMERFASGSLTKTMSERLRSVKVLYEHGLDFLGKQSIAVFTRFDDREDGGWYEADMLRSVPELLLEGLRHGLYGSSVRFEPLKWDRVRAPRRSEHNPDGLEERTVREAYIKEFSVVTFPQYEGATAGIRSLTDEVTAKQLLKDPLGLLEAFNGLGGTGQREEPQHSETTETVETSRSTQQPRDYLERKGERPAWLL